MASTTLPHEPQLHKNWESNTKNQCHRLFLEVMGNSNSISFYSLADTTEIAYR